MKTPLLRCILLFLITTGTLTAADLFAQVQTGRSYINVSKNTTGGTFEPGDVLEIRSAIAVGNFSSFSITQVRYNDTINANFTYVPNTLRILTNEGLSFRQFTDAGGDDGGMFNFVNNTLRINMGKSIGIASNTGNATTGGGTIAYNDKPSFYGGVCIMVASFRVKINTLVAYNTLLQMPGGAFRYTQSAAAKTAAFTPNSLMVFQNQGVCPNYVGGNAVIDNNGTFGSGNTQNRSSSAIVPGYTFINFASGQPNDGNYGIANNSSATGATNNGVPYPDNSRVFTVWDIIGDHTGASSPALGNPATTPGSTGGYMAVINASYATSQAIQQTVSNLCPSTYYDFSAWFRNICSKCSCDSNGHGALNALFNGPYPPGVKPNLTFQLDGIDYYTTGDIDYTGQWEKKGFTYLTGPAQTSFTFSIRNNSPGGGGNDWAVDDVNLSTCVPDLLLKYNPEIKVCNDALIDLSAVVRCYFSNYVYYKWEKSIDGGVTWNSTGVSGVGSPALVSGQWEYTAAYPLFVAALADSGSRYRIVVATTASNLTNASCSYNNNASTLVSVLNCGPILNAELKQFNGQLVQSNAQLQWSITATAAIEKFDIERSTDGSNFISIGTVYAAANTVQTSYGFTDPEPVKGITYYRLKLLEQDERLYAYSPVIALSPKAINFTVGSVTNPVTNSLSVSVVLPQHNIINLLITDMLGKPLFKMQTEGAKGWNSIPVTGIRQLPAGVYMLSVSSNNEVINKRIVKM
ncbi:MAG: T9SS type A sorting domain-containing protein [Bacteroidetes bacterium]|nr:T9SS type A sorting domain-containing protein [Bacteroidota bacterium]